MQLNKLNYFICVAKYLNFTKAAEECHLAQSAISQQINSLEKELGFKLFNRTSRSVSLTDSGKVFYENIKTVMENYNEAVKKAETAACGYKGSITLGICGGAEELAISDKLVKFKQEHPFIDLVFIKAHFDNIVEELEDKQYDAVFIWPYDVEECKDIEYKVIFNYPVCAIMNHNHTLASNKKVTREELSRENNMFISNNDKSNTYNHFSTFYSEKQLENLKTTIVSDVSILQLMLDLNKGISIVPEVVKNVKNRNFAVVDIDFEGMPHEVSYGIAYLKSNSNPCLDFFLKSIIS